MTESVNSYWIIAARRSLSRRRLLATGATAAGAAVAAAACGPSSKSPAGRSAPGSGSGSTSPGSDAAAAAIIGKEWNTSPGTPKYGGALSYASTVPALANLDPILSASQMVHYVVSNSYSKLMRVSRKNDDLNSQLIFPDLATSWETTDAARWTFHLRPGVKFHNVAPVNGRVLTAEDLKYSILRSATEKTSQVRGGFNNLDSIEIPDPQTLVLKLKRFDALLFNNLAGHYAWAVPRELAEGPGLKTNIIGTGPFVFQNWEQDSAVNFKKNPDYYLKGIPFVDELKQLQIPSQDDRIAALRSGQIMSQDAVDTANYGRLKGEGQLRFQKYAVVSPRVLFMNYKEPLFRDDRVRKAISLAISRDAIIKIENQGDGLWRGVISNQNGGWTLSQDELKGKDYFLRQDVAEAKQLMAAAGHADGFDTDLLYNTSYPEYYKNAAQYMQQALGAIGIRVNLVGQEQTAFRKNQDDHNYKGLIYGLDGEAYAEAFLLDYRSDGPKNGSGIAMDSLDKSIDDVLSTVDENDRKTKAKDLTRLILKQVLWKLEFCDDFQYSAWQAWAKNWMQPSPQVYNTTGIAFTWIDK
jgi:peptide/nickel transport system substrate-binding protein